MNIYNMKKLIFAFLLITSSLMAEQKFVYFTAKVEGYDKLNESPEIKELLKEGWTIKQIDLAGISSSFAVQVAVLLERSK